MEWFKHKTGSLDDPDINQLMDEFGDSGYIMFFGVLEIYGREYNNRDDDGFLWLNLNFVARKLRKNSAKVWKFLGYCEKHLSKQRFITKENGGKVGIKIPDFIDISSNWTKRPKGTPTEAPTEAPTAKEVEVEYKNKKKNKKENKYNDLAQNVIDYLNQKTGKKFTDTKFIIARLNEGKTAEQCMTIIDNQLQDEYFINNPKYMNPQTLFKPIHWDKYLNNTPKPKRVFVEDQDLKPKTYAQAQDAERRAIARSLLKDRDNEKHDQERTGKALLMLSTSQTNSE